VLSKRLRTRQAPGLPYRKLPLTTPVPYAPTSQSGNPKGEWQFPSMQSTIPPQRALFLLPTALISARFQRALPLPPGSPGGTPTTLFPPQHASARLLKPASAIPTPPAQSANPISTRFSQAVSFRAPYANPIPPQNNPIQTHSDPQFWNANNLSRMKANFLSFTIRRIRLLLPSHPSHRSHPSHLLSTCLTVPGVPGVSGVADVAGLPTPSSFAIRSSLLSLS